jgi:hypothetical protein
MPGVPRRAPQSRPCVHGRAEEGQGADRPGLTIPSSRGADSTSARTVQTNGNKTKQNSFHLLAFIFPNGDFSMGYGRKNKKNRARVSSCVQNVSSAPFPSAAAGRIEARTSSRPPGFVDPGGSDPGDEGPRRRPWIAASGHGVVDRRASCDALWPPRDDGAIGSYRTLTTPGLLMTYGIYNTNF